MSRFRPLGTALGAVILISSPLAGCFHAFECEDAVPFIGTKWCAEIGDPAGTPIDGSLYCRCMHPDEHAILAHGGGAVGYGGLVELLETEARLRCLDNTGGNIWCNGGAVLVESTGEVCIGEICSNDGGDEVSNGNAPPPALGIARWTDAIECDRVGDCTVDRAVFAEIVVDPGMLLSDDARFEPGVSAAGVAGWNLVIAGSDSIVHALELQLGDTLVAVNGLPLGTFEELSAALLELGGASRFSVEIHRGERTVTKLYAVAAGS